MRVRHKVALATPLTWPSETRPAKQGAKTCAQLKEGRGGHEGPHEPGRNPGPRAFRRRGNVDGTQAV